MSGSHSLSLKMKNQHATQKKSNRGKAQSLLDDEKQLRGTEDMVRPRPVLKTATAILGRSGL